MRFRFLAALLVLAALCLTALAEVDGGTSLSVTSTSQTVTFSTTRSSVSITNDSTSANELYYRLFNTCDTAAAATTSHRRLEKGETHTFRFNSNSECGLGYSAVSLVCDSAETATARVVSK